jgi:hypothetical protein
MDLFPRGRLHPLVIVAAGSLIIVSGVGIAGLAGVLPGSKAATAATAKAKKAACTDCGTVLEVKEMNVKGQGYDVSVRMADGSVKIISSAEQPAWRSGDRVRVRDGRLGPA